MNADVGSNPTVANVSRRSAETAVLEVPALTLTSDDVGPVYIGPSPPVSLAP